MELLRIKEKMQTKITINDCAIIDLPTFTDQRGCLTLVDNNAVTQLLPFKPARIFWIYGTTPSTVRGQHAHRSCWEMVCAVSGSFRLTLNDGREEKTFMLDSPCKGVIIPPMVWCRLYDFAPSTACLALASDDYDAEGYINDFEQFKNDTSND